MKKITSALLLSALLFTALPLHAETNFTTIEEALKYCPIPDLLRFSPGVAGDMHSSGTIIAVRGDEFFLNDSPRPAPAPQQVNEDKSIHLAEFRKTDTGYGRIFAGAIECYYLYPDSNGGQTWLVMSTVT